MNRERAIATAVALVAVGAAIGIGVVRKGLDQGARCGAGFVARGGRCLVQGGACPSPLVRTDRGCDAPDARVLVPATTVSIGPSDWEAEGLVAPRTIHTQPFRIDAFEVTVGRWDEHAHADIARAANGMSRESADDFCRAHGGRLPTEDEWIVAATAGGPDLGAGAAAQEQRRYPWGDTGAVCRRAAWGLVDGPCATAADGPDTVGAHPDGDSPLGIHDLAGNVAEWVQPNPAAGVSEEEPRKRNNRLSLAKGGSYASALAAELRVWAALRFAPEGAARPDLGFRCVYPP